MNAPAPATYVSLPQHALTPAPLIPPAPMQAVAQPTSPETITRVRWGRIAVVVTGAVLLAFASMNIAHVGLATGSASSPLRAAGAAPLDDIAPTIAPAAADQNTTEAAPVSKAVAPRRAMRTARVTAQRAAVSRSAVASTTSARATGGGANAAASLPYTGAETWIAALLGVLLLTAGLALQINAVRIGMTAMLYRRGILLRPIDCARMASERGLPQLRVAVSNIIERLLETPARAGSEFATSRHV